MKTIPSLVASSTVGIAAAGLALGKPERSSPRRPSSKKRKVGDTADNIIHQGSLSPASRPGTSSTLITPESKPSSLPLRNASTPNPPPSSHQRYSNSNTRSDLPRTSTGRRHSFFWNGDSSSPNELLDEDTKRESVSSRGSWIRRLSTIPNSSLNNSPRSSIGPDSPSINLSHGSAAPILSDPASSPAQLPPNKLVKRSTSGRIVNGVMQRTTARSQVPTLRRPATSHQRSITLQQQFQDDSTMLKSPLQKTPSSQARSTPASKFSTPESRHAWRLYFDSRPTKLAKERSSGRSSDGSIQDFSSSTSRRVLPDETTRPTLVKPAMIIMSKSSPIQYHEESSLGYETSDELDVVPETPLPSTEPRDMPQKRPRRSLSMHFSSPTSWISRSGSLRGNRNTETRSGGKRYASAPLPTLPGRSISTAHGPVSSRQRTTMDQDVFAKQPVLTTGASSPLDPFAKSFQTRSRNTSSPLPPLSRLSSFNIDLARLGLSSSSSSAALRSPSSPVVHAHSNSVSSTGHASPNSVLYFSSALRGPRTSEVADRASTLVGSDNETKGFPSGDEDDMDFQSETVYDSLRSGATSSVRSHGTPFDSMFEESPPSVIGHKSKRLSIHEMLNNGGFQELNNRIVEEDEGMSTPVKPARVSQDDSFQIPVRNNIRKSDEDFPSSPPSFCLASKDFGRLSLDDEDDDEDWTRDDENMEISSQLSPPSSTLNSRRVSPSFRAALADVTHNGMTNGNAGGSAERPKSNLFDWSEPSTDKMDPKGSSQRPKTAHAKQLADGRGGRAIGRRGPTALHIRSQSVPVVPDVNGQRESKMTPKFGTWGLGAKGVSEDWDNDFDFDTNDGADEDDMDHLEKSGMLVPPAIQASQANVVGHVGQIREVCLLVEDLKRLRLLAKEKGLLTGPSAPLWKEAEGIIALAVPDEEDLTLSPPHSPMSATFEVDEFDDKYQERGPDVEDVSQPEAPFEVLNRHGRPTGFMYDGSTVRRRSVVLLQDDDIFGAGILNSPHSRDHLRLPSTSPRHSSMRSVKSSSEVARSVMETMHQHRSTSDPLLQNLASQSPNKMPFDTTSLRDLVHRANVLSRTLGDLIRKADGSKSPEVSPHRDSSPAFTRVFTDPMANPPKHLPRSQSNNSVLSIDSSPTRNLGQRMHMMTVV